MDIGRAEFSLLRTAMVRGYSFNLVDLGIDTPISTMEQRLIAQLESTVRELERHSGRRIAKIYIGKTYIPRRRAPGGGFVPFDRLNPNTWRMDGIGNRWRDHRRDYGKDGLVVLSAITRETVPKGSRMSQEDLALALEQRLLHHHLLVQPDPRVVNETFTAGHLAERNYHAYAVYMAFRYEEASGQNPSTSSTPRKPIPVSQPSPTAVKSKQQEANPQLSSPTGSKNKAPRQNHISPPKRPKPSLVPTPSHAPSTTHSSPTNLTSRSLLNYQPGGTRVNLQPTATSDAVPAQTTPLASSKGKQPLNSKRKVPPKRPRSASGQTPSKKIKLSSNAPSSNTTPLSKIPSGKGSLKQTQKRPTNRQHSTPSIPSGPSRPPTFTSTPLPSPSPVKLSFNAGRSPQQVGRQPTASTNTVPTQTTSLACSSKGKQPLNYKRKVPPKRPRSASSQTPSKKIKLSSNAPSTMNQDMASGSSSTTPLSKKPSGKGGLKQTQKQPTKCSSRPHTLTSTPLHEQHVSRQPTASTNTVPAQTTSLASLSKGKYPLGSKRKVPPKRPRSASNHTPIKLSSNAPYKEIAPGPSNTTLLSKQPSGLKQTQKRSAIRQHSTSTPSIPRKSTPLPSSSPAKRVKPFQNAGRSPKVPPKQSSSQTPSKKIKLSYASPGPSNTTPTQPPPRRNERTGTTNHTFTTGPIHRPNEQAERHRQQQDSIVDLTETDSSDEEIEQ